jgi:hypothetical protein
MSVTQTVGAFKQLVLIPRAEREAQAQLRDQFTDMETLVDELRDVLRVGRRDTNVWRSQRTLAMLQWCKLAGSCGDAFGVLLQQSGIPDVLTRCSRDVARLLCSGEEELDNVLDICTAALSNACGGTVRALSDAVLQVAAGGDACGRSGDLDVVIGFADYSTGETGGRLWAGAVVLSAWFHEQQILDEWLDMSRRHHRPTMVCEIGCGPALVSAALCTDFHRRDDFTAKAATTAVDTCSIQLVVTDVSPHVVAEATKTIRDRNGCPSSMTKQRRPHKNNSADENDCCRQKQRERENEEPPPLHLKWMCEVLDFSEISADLAGQFDVVYGSDIVYDFTIASFVPAALIKLLRPGTGVAYLCCETHRDAMKTFVSTVQETYADRLVVDMNESPQVQLRQHILPVGINPKCSLMVFRRTDAA